MYDDNIAAAGIITGIGRVAGRECVIVGNDATVKGGTYYPMTVKKHLRAQEIARRTACRASTSSTPAARTCRTRTRCSPTATTSAASSTTRRRCRRHGIPQIAVVMGSCTAGGAYVPAMSRRVDHRARAGHDLPRRPAAGEGRDRRGRHRRGARRRRRAHARLGRRRPFRGGRPSRARDRAAHRRQPEPRASTIALDVARAGRAALRRPRSSTASSPPTSASPTTCARSSRASSTAASSTSSRRATARRSSPASRASAGYPVGIVANNGILFSESALKGAHFIELCCQRGIPLVFLQNITGFMVGQKYEAGGIAKDGAKMVTAVACAHVPKFTVIIGGSFGAGNYGMCGRAFDPRFLWMWPNARISVMGGEQAANVLATVRRDAIEAKGGTWSADDEEAFKAPIRDAVRARGPPVLRQRAAVGRRRHRSRRHAPRARPRAFPRRSTRRSSRRRSAYSGCRPHGPIKNRQPTDPRSAHNGARRRSATRSPSKSTERKGDRDCVMLNRPDVHNAFDER